MNQWGISCTAALLCTFTGTSQSCRRDWIIRASESAAVGASIKVSGAVSAREDASFECLALLRCPCGLYLYCRVSCDTKKNTCSLRLQTGKPTGCPWLSPLTWMPWRVPVSHLRRTAEMSSGFRSSVYFPAVIRLRISEKENIDSGSVWPGCRRRIEQGFPILLLQLLCAAAAAGVSGFAPSSAVRVCPSVGICLPLALCCSKDWTQPCSLSDSAI